MVKRFEDLNVFQRAYKASLELHKVSLTFPQIEQYALADQLRRASKSVCANIAEGFAKQESKTEFKRFVKIAAGSADETRVWLRYCFDLSYINEEVWQKQRSEYEEIAKMLQGLAKSLEKK